MVLLRGLSAVLVMLWRFPQLAENLISRRLSRDRRLCRLRILIPQAERPGGWPGEQWATRPLPPKFALLLPAREHRNFTGPHSRLRFQLQAIELTRNSFVVRQAICCLVYLQFSVS